MKISDCWERIHQIDLQIADLMDEREQITLALYNCKSGDASTNTWGKKAESLRCFANQFIRGYADSARLIEDNFKTADVEGAKKQWMIKKEPKT